MEFDQFLYLFVSWKTLAILFLCFVLIKWIKKNQDLPPGSVIVLFINYFLYKKPPPETLLELSKKYGNLMSVRFATSLCVIISDLETIKECFSVNDSCASRYFDIFKFLGLEKSILAVGSEESKDLRRFFLSFLKDFGKENLESKITDEINYLISELSKFNGEPINPRRLLTLSIANIINLHETGERFLYSDVRFNRRINLQTFIFHEFPKYYLFAISPLIFSLLTSMRLIPNFHRMIEELTEMLKVSIKVHKAEFEPGSRKDMIDAFLTERNEHMKKTGSEGIFTDDILVQNMYIVSFAGFDTTSNTLLWTILYLTKHPEVQKKIKTEIENVIGNERAPSLSDRNLLPFTNATIFEIMRIAPVAPLALPHMNDKEFMINGYRIPEKSIIVPNLWQVQNDKGIWNDPDVFRPERFIDDLGNVNKSKYLIPFSIGKRNCVGENLADKMLFLYITNLLQSFTFEPVQDAQKISLEATDSFTRNPKSFEVRIFRNETRKN